jgi:hypothetical protein
MHYYLTLMLPFVCSKLSIVDLYQDMQYVTSDLSRDRDPEESSRSLPPSSLLQTQSGPAMSIRPGEYSMYVMQIQNSRTPILVSKHYHCSPIFANDFVIVVVISTLAALSLLI